MDISTDFIRRQAKDSQVEHDASMTTMSDVVGRLFGGGTTESGVAKADFVTGGLNRRRFLQVGGLTVATAAVFAACGTDGTAGGGMAVEDQDQDQEGSGSSDGDITILRTASSLEVLAVDVYQKAIDSGLVKTVAIADAAKLFQAQHREHAALFQGATKKAGGKEMTKPNPVVLQGLQGPLAALQDETGVVQLALMLEQAAAATYQSTVGAFTDPTLNQAVMSVGGVEARHVAVLSSVLAQPGAPKAFQTTDGAVVTGTGV
ncbi:MAG TPA: ferritin-like domain-containing protein [Acidimicrobiales bacterium]|nr:ferritin-like domain-containing protein [Acidimicrobiales bacterium]